jgi:hypothetical protein
MGIIMPGLFFEMVLEVKEAWKTQRDGSNTSTGFVVHAGALWRGSPERALEPIATHRLGLHMGTSGKVLGRSLMDTIARNQER